MVQVGLTINDYLMRAGRLPDGGLRLLDRAEQARWVGWDEVRARALAVCGGLLALGVQRGDRVALVFPTGLDFFSAFFGTLLAGAVPAPLYPPVRLGRLREYFARTTRMLEIAAARVVLADARIERLLGEPVAAARPRYGCLTLADLPGAAAPAQPVRVRPDELALVQFSSGTTVAPKAVALSHRAVVAQTEILSGFWRDEEGLRHSCASWLPLYHDMGLIGCVFPALARDATLTLLPPELFVARPALWLRAIARYRATISPAPNFGYSLCLTRVADADLEGVDLSCWRAALNGAEPVAPAVLQAFAERFARWGFSPAALTPVYGLSEAALAVTFSELERPYRSGWFDREALSRERLARPVPAHGGSPSAPGGHRPPGHPGEPGERVERARGEGDPAGDGAERDGDPVAAGGERGWDPVARRAGGRDGDPQAAGPERATRGADCGVEIVSVGRPVPGFRLAVRDPQGRDLPPGRVGRLWIRGPSLMEGYLGDPEGTARALRDGWLDTGDLGFVDQGELFLTGRAKDLIILRGRNHSPAEIEQAVDAVSGVRAGCAVAVSWLPEGAAGEVLALFVERARGATPAQLAELPDACGKAVLAATGLAVDRLEVLAPGTLPRTSSGKLRRSEALRLYREGGLTPPAPVTVMRLAREVVRSRLAYARHRRLERRGKVPP
jgi:acyl-CoA synthetase (AMP-forming)/AMP-acid ligase II